MDSGAAVSPADVAAARDVLGPIVTRTPLLHSWVLSQRLAGPVYLKCENLQRTGSFKVRGAYLRISRLTDAQRARGVIAASAGNHAQGVAYAAGLLGAKATVVMPEGAPLPKVEATRSYGAEIILHGTVVEHALARAREIAAERGLVFIHPFEHPYVIAGQGTTGLEILEQCPDVATIAVPAGGGGLVAGIAVAVSDARPAVQVVGVQAAALAPLAAGLTAGRRMTAEPAVTMADGIAVAEPGELAFRLLARLQVPMVTVTEESISRALLLCLERAKQVVEPAGAAGVAALLEHPDAFRPPVVVVLSGGNIDPLLLSKVLQYGLSAAGRYLAFRCTLPDRPGELARLLAELAALGSNVLDVVHGRFSPHLTVDEAEVSLQVETRGPGHSDQVIGRLRAAGYQLRLD